MCPAIVLKYTSVRSGSVASKPGPGDASSYTCTTVRPPSSVVEITPWSRCIAGKVPRDHASPDAAANALHRLHRLRLEQDPPRLMIAMRVHSSDYILDDVRGENHHAGFAELAQQVEETHALGRIEPGGGLIDDQQLRIAQQPHGHAEALFHAAREATQLLIAYVPQIHLAQQRIDHVRGSHARQCPSARRSEAADARWHADTRRIPAAGSQRLAHVFLVAQHVELAEHRMPAVGSCSVARMRINVDLPAPLGPSRPYMPTGIVSDHLSAPARRSDRSSRPGESAIPSAPSSGVPEQQQRDVARPRSVELDKKHPLPRPSWSSPSTTFKAAVDPSSSARQWE